MAYSIFSEKTKKPGNDELAVALGRSHALWEELRNLAALEFDPLTEEWVYSGKNYGWSLRLKQKKRAILYMTPGERYFRVGLVFGEKAVQAAHECNLPPSLVSFIDEAPKYPEGRALRFEIKKKADVRVAVRLAGIKMAN